MFSIGCNQDLINAGTSEAVVTGPNGNNQYSLKGAKGDRNSYNFKNLG